ncbi:hypothetical protein CRENBAI_024319 [Crenichthys baileyi]|uniref:Uncharacterized protein n=1 Tax=Crenichthys baileyi TaxID=28760 RepID=A0AAV9S3K7_9TELE
MVERLLYSSIAHCDIRALTPFPVSCNAWSRCRYPIGAPAPGPRRCSPSLRGGDRQNAPVPAQTSAGTTRTRATPARTLTPRPDPRTQRPSFPSREGTKYKRGVHLVQTSPPTRAATG